MRAVLGEVMAWRTGKGARERRRCKSDAGRAAQTCADSGDAASVAPRSAPEEQVVEGVDGLCGGALTESLRANWCAAAGVEGGYEGDDEEAGVVDEEASTGDSAEWAGNVVVQPARCLGGGRPSFKGTDLRALLIRCVEYLRKYDVWPGRDNVIGRDVQKHVRKDKYSAEFLQVAVDVLAPEFLSRDVADQGRIGWNTVMQVFVKKPPWTIERKRALLERCVEHRREHQAWPARGTADGDAVT